MNLSEKTTALCKALGEFQSQCANVAPNAEGQVGTRKFGYADLAAVIDEIKPKLAAHGLAVIQSPVDREGAVGVSTIITHSSGEWLDCGEILLPLKQNTAQEAGACITYARRYSLSALAGIASEADTDGPQPGAGARSQRSAPPPAQPATGSGVPAAEGVWNKQLGFGMYADLTWGELCQGSINGRRHKYITHMVGELNPEESEEAAAKHGYFIKALAMYGKRQGEESF
jgi:hypothetical protein